MTKSAGGVHAKRCPACSASVRVDRLEHHLRAVHPGYKPSSKFREELETSVKFSPFRTRKHADLKVWFTKWRVVGIVALVIVTGVIVYAFTRPSPNYAQVGKPAPEFSFTDIYGNSHDLGSLGGHPVLILFMTTWCTYCQQASDVFAQNYYPQYRAANITFLELQLYNNLGQSGPSLNTFASSNGYSGQAGWLVGPVDSGTTTLYDSGGTPDTYYLISSHGIVLSTGSGLSGALGSLLTQAKGQ